MTPTLASHGEGSALLRLPVEVRLHIYSFILPDEILNINLCNIRWSAEPHPPNILPRSLSGGKASPISSLVSQVLELESITRLNGLHLLTVSRRTHKEVAPLLSQLTVRFHCPKCFEDLLANLSHGLGVGVASWMKHVEIRFDCGNGLFPGGGPADINVHRGGTPSLARFMAGEAMQAVQRTAWLYYGRLDLMGREKWKFEPMTDGHGWEPNHWGGGRHYRRASLPGRGRLALAHYPMLAWQQPQHQQPGVTGMHDGQEQRQGAHREWVISGWFDV